MSKVRSAFIAAVTGSDNRICIVFITGVTI